ncbi:MAG: cyclic-di-AMP receptor [Clostridia bacterium]|nr:cyclic-di-AMP receptor [Clostridia bacterium]
MKLIFAIVNGEDAAVVSTELTRAGYIVTKLATKGGFLKVGNTTFLIGVEEEKVEDVIGIIREYSSKRTQTVPDLSAFPGDTLALPLEVTVGGATIFVTDVDRFEKF